MAASETQRAKTAERRSKAIALRLAGTEWQQIADTLGYANRGAACKDVTRALEAGQADQRVSAGVRRDTELLRLDRIQRGLWPAAIAGDTKAADTVLRVIDYRVRLAGGDGEPGPVERQVREDIAALGPLTGIRPSIAEIAYALARVLDSGDVTAPAAIARELAARVQSLVVMTAGNRKESVVDQLAARRARAQAAARASGT